MKFMKKWGVAFKNLKIKKSQGQKNFCPHNFFCAPCWNRPVIRLKRRVGWPGEPKRKILNCLQIFWCTILKIVRTFFAACGGEEKPPWFCGSPASGLAAFFDNFKFFYKLIITHYSKSFKKKFSDLAANSLIKIKKRKKQFRELLSSLIVNK